MDFDDTFLDRNRLPVVCDVFMLRNLDRLVFVGQVVKFLKSHQIPAAKSRSIERVFHFDFHFLTVSSKCVFILHTLAINEKFSIFSFIHLPALELVLCAFFQTVQSNGIHDSDLFGSSD